MASPATAAPWARLSLSATGTTISVDLGSIRGGQIRTAWVRYRYSQPQGKGVVEAMDLSSFNCQTEESSSTSWVEYDAQGRSLGSQTSLRPNWSPVIPDSVGATQLRFICSYPIGTDWRTIEGLRIEN